MLLAASRHYAESLALAERAAIKAREAAPGGIRAVARVLALHQVSQAVRSERAVNAMLAEQSVDVTPAARIAPSGFVTSEALFAAMAETATSLERLVGSLVQDAGRAAESVAVAARPRAGYVRYLSPPSCSRCAVLAGRDYRYSTGFQRHPHCDCVMVPALESVAPNLTADVDGLVRSGQVTGLSKSDLRAIGDGADLNQVVNVRRKAAGLQESGRVLARRGRLTPEGIYRVASDRTEAVQLLKRFGYLL